MISHYNTVDCMKGKRRSLKGKERVTIYLPPEVDDLLRLYAELTGQSIAAAGEELMSRGIAEYKFNQGDIDGAADILRSLREEKEK